MKKIFVAAIFLFGIILTTTASASNWAYATINPLGAWYVDRDSIYLDRNENYDLVFHAFVKKELSGNERAKPENANVSHVIYLEEFAFHEGVKYAHVLSSTKYMTNGTAGSTDNSPTEWWIIVPDSVADYLYDTAYRFLKLKENL